VSGENVKMIQEAGEETQEKVPTSNGICGGKPEKGEE